MYQWALTMFYTHHTFKGCFKAILIDILLLVTFLHLKRETYRSVHQKFVILFVIICYLFILFFSFFHFLRHF